jgi:hypothetical protein
MQALSDLTRPAPLVAAAVLAVNDHVLKGSGLLPGAFTGKLSDVAGLFVAPILAVALARGAAQRLTGNLPPRDGRVAGISVLLVALGFALLKSWPAFHAAVNAMWGSHVLDPADLWCLPMVVLAWVWLGDRERAVERAPRRFSSAFAATGTLLVCAATSRAPPVPPPSIPMWSIARQPLALPCGEATVWVAKSGKTGLGVTVRVVPRAKQPCDAKVSATLRFADRAFAGTHVIAKPGRELHVSEDRPSASEPPDPALFDAVYHYVAFELDNEARWNRGERTATLELAIDTGGQVNRWKLPATHAYAEFPVGRDR